MRFAMNAAKARVSHSRAPSFPPRFRMSTSHAARSEASRTDAEACRERARRVLAEAALLLARSRAQKARHAEAIPALQSAIPVLRREVADYGRALRRAGIPREEAERRLRELSQVVPPAIPEDAEAIVELVATEITRAYAA